MDNNTPNGTCYICGHGNTDVIQRHHIIPRRYDGTDEDRNIVTLCPTCHYAIERIYDDSFFEELGVEIEDSTREVEDQQCEWRTCSADASYRIEGSGYELHVCDGHRKCQWEYCTQIGSPIPIEDEDLSIACSEHRTCYHEDCLSKDTAIYNLEYSGRTVSCAAHTENLAEDEEEAARQARVERKQREYSRRIKDAIHDLQESHGDKPGAPVNKVYAAFGDDDIVEDEIDQIVQKFRDKGEVYSADRSHLRVV